MLQENKSKKTPEEIKKARAARIKTQAAAVYAGSIGSMLATPGTIVQMNTFGENHEQRLAYLKLKSSAWAEVCIMMAVEFEDVWKKKKGSFLHDEA